MQWADIKFFCAAANSNQKMRFKKCQFSSDVHFRKAYRNSGKMRRTAFRKYVTEKILYFSN